MACCSLASGFWVEDWTLGPNSLKAIRVGLVNLPLKLDERHVHGAGGVLLSTSDMLTTNLSESGLTRWVMVELQFRQRDSGHLKRKKLTKKGMDKL